MKKKKPLFAGGSSSSFQSNVEQVIGDETCGSSSLSPIAQTAPSPVGFTGLPREIQFKDLSKEEQAIVCFWVRIGLKVDYRFLHDDDGFWTDNEGDDPREFITCIYRLAPRM